MEIFCLIKNQNMTIEGYLGVLSSILVFRLFSYAETVGLPIVK
jgi:hypothetical protein